MNVLVCGGRDYADACALNEALDAIHREVPITRLIHGAARGADALAAAWAHSRGIPALAFPADWKRDGKAGYLAHIPRLWRLLEADLRDPVLDDVARWFDRHLPAVMRRVPDLPATV